MAPGSVALRRLGIETFGQKIARARMLSRIGLRGAADAITEAAFPVSFASLARLEDLPESPADVRRRMVATLAVLAYGFEPDDFGLTIDDLPRSIDVDAFLDAVRARSRSRCFSSLAAPLAIPA